MTEVEKVLKEIKESNENKYGKIQECCGFHKSFCRCGTESKTSKFLKSLVK